ncbi:hypothetical protein WMF31_12245 [Sorangium sp. So ce1036]|uniref:hypothetical protein n=1 Tax=Sorangium sp. So ce1036 TaxID=3133328 RepID=UPI003F0C5FE1
MSIRSFAGGLLFMGALMTGCIGPDDSGGLPGESPAEGAAEMTLGTRMIVPIGANGMRPADFWAPANREAFKALGRAALAGRHGELVKTPLLDTEGGRSVLDYTVRCALLPDQVVHAPDGEAFHGAFGFAPAWAERDLDVSEQRWVSACLFQHMNGSGEHVEILLEGRHPALAYSRDEAPAADFRVRDATMFGNAFDEGAIVGYACIDPDLGGTLSSLSSSCPLDLALLEPKRLCGKVQPCGIAFLGLCDLSCVEDTNGDQTCYTFPPLLGSLLGIWGTRYPETIRTEVRDEDLLPLYPGCGLL